MRLKYVVGDVVKCLSRGQLYDSKILKIDAANPKGPYRVHYVGWNDRYDEWVASSQIKSLVASSVGTSQSPHSREKSVEKGKRVTPKKTTASFGQESLSKRPLKPSSNDPAKKAKFEQKSEKCTAPSSANTKQGSEHNLQTCKHSRTVGPSNPLERVQVQKPKTATMSPTKKVRIDYDKSFKVKLAPLTKPTSTRNSHENNTSAAKAISTNYPTSMEASPRQSELEFPFPQKEWSVQPPKAHHAESGAQQRGSPKKSRLRTESACSAAESISLDFDSQDLSTELEDEPTCSRRSQVISPTTAMLSIACDLDKSEIMPEKVELESIVRELQDAGRKYSVDSRISNADSFHYHQDLGANKPHDPANELFDAEFATLDPSYFNSDGINMLWLNEYAGDPMEDVQAAPIAEEDEEIDVVTSDEKDDPAEIARILGEPAAEVVVGEKKKRSRKASNHFIREPRAPANIQPRPEPGTLSLTLPPGIKASQVSLPTGVQILAGKHGEQLLLAGSGMNAMQRQLRNPSTSTQRHLSPANPDHCYGRQHTSPRFVTPQILQRAEKVPMRFPIATIPTPAFRRPTQPVVMSTSKFAPKLAPKSRPAMQPVQFSRQPPGPTHLVRLQSAQGPSKAVVTTQQVFVIEGGTGSFRTVRTLLPLGTDMTKRQSQPVQLVAL